MNIHRIVPDSRGELAFPTLGDGRKNAVCIGNFDGVHLGHQAVLKQTVSRAKADGGLSIALLFEPRPAIVHGYARLHPQAELSVDELVALPDPSALTSMDQRLKLIEKIGIDEAIVIRYTPAFAQQTYMYFLGSLAGKLGMKTLVLGPDARLGKDRKGDIAAMDRLAQATRMFELTVVDNTGPGFVHVPDGEMQGVAVEKQVRVWSSSNIRHLLEIGDISGANEILGHRHSVVGTVVHGDELGRELGFPTANLGGATEGFMPADGVYAGQVSVVGDDGSHAVEALPAAISIGTKETFEDEIGKRSRLLEANILDTDWVDLYGSRLSVEFVARIRGQEKFDSADELVSQMNSDVVQIRRALTDTDGRSHD
jgi:riboflavin kinase/FMN adenylyltransferase